MWTCPACKKQFARENQWHSCSSVGIEQHFTGKDPKLEKIFSTLMARMKSFGEIRMQPAKSSIQFLSSTTFLSVKVLKDSLNLEFFLKKKTDAYPIYKTMQLSNKKIVHYVRISNGKEIDKQLIQWLRESFEMNSPSQN